MGRTCRLGAWLGILVASAVAPAGGPAPAQAQETVAFRGRAAAEGVRIAVEAQGGPVVNRVVDGASPIAQAALDSTAGGSALGSVAYPGDLVVTAPGLLAGFSGGQTSDVVPQYPLIATAGSTSVSESRVDVPGGSMQAAASDRRAEGSARSGAADAKPSDDDSNGSASAVAGVVAGEDNVVTATASSEVRSLTAGPLLLGRVVARSVVTRAPGAEPVRDASFEATGITVGGVAVSLTPGGLVLAGTTTPVSASPLQPVLDAAGISVRTVAAQETDDGIVSEGLIVSRTQDLPTTISPATVSFTFGQAVAGVASVPLALVVAPSPPPVAPPGTTPTDPVVVPATAPALPPAPVPAPAFTVPGLPVGLGPGQDGAAPAGVALAPVTPTIGAGQPAARIRVGGAGFFDVSAFYLVLVLAVVCAGVVLELFRHLGVRLSWTSKPG